jgi:hypothetical protein
MSRALDLYERLVAGGEAELDLMIADRVSEELFLDFKASAENGGGSNLSHADREKLAKAISGFGNAEGGVIVWGVECENSMQAGDVASGKMPIQNPTRFKSWLEKAVSGCTLPPHGGVQHRVLMASSGADEGFVLTLIPMSNRAPHQCIVDKHRHRYFIRVGSSFDHVPHGVLAGMFGRRPPTRVTGSWNSYGGGVSGSNEGIISPNPRPEHTAYFPWASSCETTALVSRRSELGRYREAAPCWL